MGENSKDELSVIMQEASKAVETELALEDAGWINLSGASGDIILGPERIDNLKLSRLYYTKDPIGHQSVRLWTDYTFGEGMTFRAKEDKTQEVLAKYWLNPNNRSVLSARGQRKSSDKLMVDGEVFFVQFLGAQGDEKIRWIDPLQITEIITKPDDIESVMYYERSWTDNQGKSHITIYRSATNIKDEGTKNAAGKDVEKTDDGIVSHLTYNTITQRGNPLLLPALRWLKYNTKYIGSRIAVMLALATWAWKQKVTGGQSQVDTIKAKTHEKEVAAGSTFQENLGVETTPIKTETGGKAASEDGRQIKLMAYAAVGLSEQYFGDISTGNLATAKTVELPMLKQFRSLQKVWDDFYKELDEIVLAHNQIPPDKWYVDRDFPLIAPRDVVAAADSLEKIVRTFPQFADSMEVQQVALSALSIDDTTQVLATLDQEAKKNPARVLSKVLKEIRRDYIVMVEKTKKE